MLEEQLDFPVLYASAKEGWASSTFTKEPPADARNMSQLLDALVKHVPPPKADLDEPFLMLVIKKFWTWVANVVHTTSFTNFTNIFRF